MLNHSIRNLKPVVLDSKDLTSEEFQVLCDVFETLLKWDREAKAKDKAVRQGDLSSKPV